MTDTPTNRYGARQQSLGSNVNTWGDTKLNEVLTLFDRGSKGYQALTVTGDATLTWTNYIATNDGQVATLKLNGTPAAAFTLTFPSKEWELTVWNNSGQTATLKCSGGTGVAIPTGRKVRVFSDGVDVGDSTPNYLPTATTLTNNQDLVSNAQLAAAVAAIAAATNGLVLTSTTATSGKYLNTGLVATANGGLKLTKINAGTASEAITAEIDAAANLAATTNVVSTDRFVLYDVTAAATKYQTRANVVGKFGLISQASAATQAVIAGNLYPLDCTSSAGTLTLPAAATAGDVFGVVIFGTNGWTMNTNSLNYYGAAYSAFAGSAEGLTLFYYTGASRGWVDL